MAPSRRPLSNGHITTQNTPMHLNSQNQQKTQRHRSPPTIPAEQTNLGMSPTSRYNHNLKVLRRRDPSIVSIFDQFSHVCVYHHNGKKWEKQGFEGSMFLYERDSYPPYGFYILNRMGMDDYIQRLFPEDDIGAHGSYLMLRSYPEFTTRRLSLAHSSSTEIPHKFADCYAIPYPEQLLPKDKGRSQTVGLWMFATDAREPMIDVMMRLHSYIKKNMPYPEEFRYGPDRPPPPNPYLRTISTPSSPSQVVNARSGNPETSNHSPPSPSHTPDSPDHFSRTYSQELTNGAISELDMLFAKLAPTPILSAMSTSAPAEIPNSTSQMTVDSLFAALSGADLHDSPGPTLPPSRSPSLNRGLTLLDSIFASADTPNSKTSVSSSITNTTLPLPSTSSPTIPTEPITIYSPTPTSTALPQILTQDVISSLLGLPPSRTASAANSTSTSYSGGGHSHSSSREGDNEDEGEIDEVEDEAGVKRRRSDGGYSESSTVLDQEVEVDEFMAAGAGTEVPVLSLVSGDEQLGGGGSPVNGKGRLNGDVTPRPLGYDTWPRMKASSQFTPPLGGSDGSLYVPTGNGPERRTKTEPLSTLMTTKLQGQSSMLQPERRHGQPLESDNANDDTLSRRALAPFETKSKLRPSRPPIDDSTGDVEEEDGDIIELDFADTSALSDPDVFRRVSQMGRRGRQEQGVVRDQDGDTSAVESGSRDVAGKNKGKAKAKAKKKGRKEKAAQKERRRDETEQSRDVPEFTSSVQDSESERNLDGVHDSASCPSPSPVPIHKRPNRSVESETPTAANTNRAQIENGLGHAHLHSGNSKEEAQKKTTEDIKVGINGGGMDKQKMRECVIGTVRAQARNPVRMERNEFVREVLTLIHTDKNFVDTLWQDYMARLE